ncbi:MAG: RidA family protein [Streptosporangiales bacterium]|nr:RidA family protein [Streptosporangiales bacterium]
MRTTFDNPAAVPPPVGQYSHVARLDLGTGSLLFLSGQVALDSDGKLVGEGDMAEQSRYVFETIGGILAAHGAGFDNVINIRSYLTDMELLPEYAAVRRRYLTGEPPTSTTVGVTRLVRPGLLLEVEVVAAVSSAPRAD